ncbi:MAG: phosphoheptose isomerase [Deltaproteobacteria bacterium]|nr:phosphoheptose isomerase [Deltaproteobacteria bacterium]|tara:strand:+ start:36924 stop:37574 length:651 start_codon:yes stop_codon:yes gene_type:complete
MSDPLNMLYPQLGHSKGATDDELLQSIRTKADESLEAKRVFFETSSGDLLEMAKSIAQMYKKGGTLLTMGNGGSSCDAAHVAVEFKHPVTVGRKALPAIHLGADLAMLTAIGNDIGFDAIFSRQVIALGQKGDALIGFSTSGNSKNLLAAFTQAHRQGLKTLGFAGGDGGLMKQSKDIDICVVVPSTSIHRIQECHVAAYHILWDLVHTLLAEPND